MTKKWRKALTVLAAGALLTTACGGASDDVVSQSGEQTTPAAQPDASSPTVEEPTGSTAGTASASVFYIAKRLDQGWFQNEAEGVESAAAAAGLDVTVLDSRFDASVEQSHIDQAIDQDAGGSSSSSRISSGDQPSWRRRRTPTCR